MNNPPFYRSPMRFTFGRGLLFSLIAVASAGAIPVRASTPTLVIEGILRDGQGIPSAADVTVSGLGVSAVREGVREGESLPNDVRISVPAGESVTVAFDTGTVMLNGATDSFHYTGKFESVAMLVPGRTEIADASDGFRFFGPSFELSVYDGAYAVAIAGGRATVTRTAGTVTADLLGAGAFVMRVDVLTKERPSIAYTLGAQTLADAAALQDEVAAESGDPNGEFDLGMRLYWGDGLAADAAQAKRWLRAAAAQRFGEAENTMGYIYVYGPPGEQDAARALHWFELAASDGSAAAEDTLGDMYNYGHGVAQSYARAMHWYQLSAAQGDADAENDVGLLYYLGHSSYFGDTQPEYDAAMHWFWIAAAQGNGDAENDVGYAYENGRGVPLDYSRALQWYHLSADQRDRAAEYNLGRMYEIGRGVSQDNAQALSWYRLAAAQGLQRAADAIERIQRPQPR